MNYILFDDPEIRKSLLPLTFTRPVSGIRIGIYTIAEKWSIYLKQPVFFQTEGYLSKKFPFHNDRGPSVFINGGVCPTGEFTQYIHQLNSGECLMQGNMVLAYCNAPEKIREYEGKLTILKTLWDIFLWNSEEISADFQLIKKTGKSATIQDPHTKTYNPENIFVEEGVVIKAAIINAEAGPVYLGKNSVVNEGALIKGPFCLGEGSQITMGAKMRGDSTIGPYCKIGGEVSNSILFGYSNKGHDGFIGNTIIGEWCNLGADTNTSNLKNNYGEVELYSYKEKKLIKTGRQFMGLVMGDHSKCGINTMFNTGTVVGVSSNIFGGGFPPKFIPSFSWGGAAGFTRFDLEKSFEIAQAVMSRRNLNFGQTDKEIFQTIFQDQDS